MDGIDTEKIPLLTGVDNPGADEDIELHQTTSSRRGSADPTGHHRTYEETSFEEDISTQEKNDIVRLFRQEEKNVDDA